MWKWVVLITMSSRYSLGWQCNDLREWFGVKRKNIKFVPKKKHLSIE